MTVFAATFDSVIVRLAKSPELHAKFVNSISLLEYMGARKILKSQRAETMTAKTLAHAAEEVRHAQAFKQIALKMSGGALESYSEEHVLCAEAARGYIQGIDHGVSAELQSCRAGRPARQHGNDPWTNYLLTTLMVEERANRIYPQYDIILSELGFPGVLRGIIREEGAHLEDILLELNDIESVGPERLGRLRALEDQLFGRWMGQVEGCLE